MTKVLKIGFDAKRLFHNKEGLGAYARTLVSDLQRFYPQHEYYLFTPSHPPIDYPHFSDPNRFKCIIPQKGTNKTLWRYKNMTNEIAEIKLDVYVGLSNELPIGIEDLSLNKVVVIHDVFHKTFPKQFSFIDRAIIEKKYRHAIKAADKVIAISDSTAKLIEQYYPESRTKVERVYQSLSPDLRNIKKTTSQRKDFFLMVGTTSARKNLEAVIQAYEKLDLQDRVQIKIVGRDTSYLAKIKELIKSKNLDKYFEFLGHVSQDQLMSLYREALALVFPSHDEGFGRPVLEAIYFDLPVIAYDRASIPEVIGKYGIIVEYDRADALKEAFGNFLKKGFQIEKEGRKEHLSKFDPELLSQLIMKTLSDVK